jgi:hypothetical protein
LPKNGMVVVNFLFSSISLIPFHGSSKPGKMFQPKTKKMRLTKQLKTDVVIFVEDLKVKKKKNEERVSYLKHQIKEKHGEG